MILIVALPIVFCMYLGSDNKKAGTGSQHSSEKCKTFKHANKFTESENWEKKSNEQERYGDYKNSQILRTAVLNNLHIYEK